MDFWWHAKPQQHTTCDDQPKTDEGPKDVECTPQPRALVGSLDHLDLPRRAHLRSAAARPRRGTPPTQPPAHGRQRSLTLAPRVARNKAKGGC